MNVFITGAAGFIGSELSLRLLNQQCSVTGIDSLNDYYDPALKRARLARLAGYDRFRFIEGNIEDRSLIDRVFDSQKFDVVVNLAAQAGVRYSLVNPMAYVDTNLLGFANILEGCKRTKVGHFVFASSSSVYGANTKLPFSESDNVDHPVSLYAATKKANELMAHSYAHLYGLPCTGLRFFTVYGPWGRPDMAYFSFTQKILAGEPIPVFNNGKMLRDFTYIDDIVEGVVKLLGKAPSGNPVWSGDNPDPATSYAPYRIYNIGNNQGVELLYFINLLEKNLGVEANMEMLPMQAGDVTQTLADTSALYAAIGYRPSTPVEDGVKQFVSWYVDYHKAN